MTGLEQLYSEPALETFMSVFRSGNASIKGLWPHSSPSALLELRWGSLQDGGAMIIGMILLAAYCLSFVFFKTQKRCMFGSGSIRLENISGGNQPYSCFFFAPLNILNTSAITNGVRCVLNGKKCEVGRMGVFSSSDLIEGVCAVVARLLLHSLHLFSALWATGGVELKSSIGKVGVGTRFLRFFFVKTSFSRTRRLILILLALGTRVSAEHHGEMSSSLWIHHLGTTFCVVRV